MTARRLVFGGFAVGALLLAACTASNEQDDAEATSSDTIVWPASAETEAALGVVRWRLEVAPDGTVEVVGQRADGRVTSAERASLRQRTEDPRGVRSVLRVGGGAIEFLPDGSVGEETLSREPVLEGGARAWEVFLLASLVDRIASGESARGAASTRTLRPAVVGVGAPLLGAPSTLVDGCRGARGEASYWTAAQGALACEPSFEAADRGPRSFHPYTAAVVRAGTFEPTEDRCAIAAKVLAGTGEAAHGCPRPGEGPVQLVSWRESLLRRACLAGVAATTAGMGGLTYWVCTGTAVVASGAACTVVVPGVGTVTCGAAGGAIAQPVCASGALAVAAGAAAAGLRACNVVTSAPAGPRELGSLEEFAGRIAGTYSCQQSFQQPAGDCVLRAPPPGWNGPFHRVTTASSGFTDKCAAETCELWGAGYRGGFPCAQAYVGPLPAGEAGFEFYTDATTRSGGAIQRWCAVEDAPDPTIHRENDTHGAIKVAITKVQR